MSRFGISPSAVESSFFPRGIPPGAKVIPPFQQSRILEPEIYAFLEFVKNLQYKEDNIFTKADFLANQLGISRGAALDIIDASMSRR